MKKNSLKWLLGVAMVIAALTYFKSAYDGKLKTRLAAPSPVQVPAPEDSAATAGASGTPTSATTSPKDKSTTKAGIIPARGYEVVKSRVSGTFAVKVGEKTITSGFNDVTPFACPAPDHGKLCLVLRDRQVIVVSKELSPLLPNNFYYYVKHP
jgi:hypothetical protein